MATTKQRVHNEWFMPLAKRRKKCPECHAPITSIESIWAWGEYHNCRWNKITEFCRSCFNERVRDKLKEHTDSCGCAVTLCARSGYQLPSWLALDRLEDLIGRRIEINDTCFVSEWVGWQGTVASVYRASQEAVVARMDNRRILSLARSSINLI